MKKLLASLLVVCTLICAMTIFASAADDVAITFRPDGSGSEGNVFDTNAHVNGTQYFCDGGTHVTLKYTADFAAAKKVTFQCGIWGWLLFSVSTDNATWTDLITATDVMGTQTIQLDLTDKFDRSVGDLYIRIAHSGFTYNPDSSMASHIDGTAEGNGGSLLFREDAILTLKNSEHTAVVPMFGFDADITGAAADAETKIDGDAACIYTFTAEAGTKVIQYVFETPVDVTACDAVEFYLYVSDVAVLDNIGGGQLELTSGGTCDVEETNWTTESLKSLIVGEPKAGWNLVHLAIGGACNWDRVNFFRIYIPGITGDKGAALDGKQIGFDMMYAVGEDAVAPVPSTLAPVDPTPSDPTDPTDPNPGTFDAASSVAVFAVAALGIALVASKKRH